MRKLPISPFVINKVECYNFSIELPLENACRHLHYVEASMSPDALPEQFISVRKKILLQIINDSYPVSLQQKRTAKLSDPAQCNCREYIHGLPAAGTRFTDIIRETDT